MHRTRRIRVAIFYAVLHGIGSVKVYIPICGNGYGFRLLQCSQCEQLMGIDLQDPRLASKKYETQITAGPCPNCGREMKESLLDYPSEFRTGGKKGMIDVPQVSDEMSRELIEIYELNL